MAKHKTLKRALSILLALCLVMSVFAVNVFADTVTNPDGTTTETTVNTETQADTPSAGYTTTTTTTTAVTSGTITETGAVVDGTVTNTDMSVTKPSDFVRYGEHTVEGYRTETIASVESDYAPNVTVTLNPGSTASQTETGSSSAQGSHTDTKNGANDPKYDYDQTTTTASRTVSVTAGNVTTTETPVGGAEMTYVGGENYSGKQNVVGSVPTAPTSGTLAAIEAPGHEGLYYLNGVGDQINQQNGDKIAIAVDAKVEEDGDNNRVFTRPGEDSHVLYTKPWGGFILWNNDFRDENNVPKPIWVLCADHPTLPSDLAAP